LSSPPRSSALLASGVVPGERSTPVAVADYLAWLSVPEPRTIYRGIRALSPATASDFRRGELEIRPHVVVPVRLPRRRRVRRARNLSGSCASGSRTRSRRMIADVPVGRFCRGASTRRWSPASCRAPPTMPPDLLDRLRGGRLFGGRRRGGQRPPFRSRAPHPDSHRVTRWRGTWTNSIGLRPADGRRRQHLLREPDGPGGRR
jgi:hypothetical protein